MQCVPESAQAGPPPLGMHREPHLPSHAHKQTAVNLHMQPYIHTRSCGINATFTSSQIKKRNGRNVVFIVIKNDLKNITSSFPVAHSVKEGLQNEQMPAVANATLSTYTAPRDWCRAATSEPKHCRNCLLQAWTLGEGKPQAMPSGRPDPLSSEKHGRSSGTWLC